METKVKENGQAKENTVKTDKIQRFVAGNPVNAVSNKSVQEKEQPKPETVKSQEEVKPKYLQPLKNRKTCKQYYIVIRTA